MSSIDNKGENTLSAALKDMLPNCDRVDALVGYFYFSGFRDLHKELADKKIRILVGMDIDRKVVERISAIKDVNLDSYLTDDQVSSRAGVKENYFTIFSRVFNDTDHFDDSEAQVAFKTFLEKIMDGSLEIKKTPTANHSKFYILHNKEELSSKGRMPGVVISGSSNLSISGLKGQGEHNRTLTEKHYYDEDTKRFDEAWNDSENIVIADLDSANEFVKEVKKRIWLYALPEPQDMFYRVLDEYFSLDDVEEMKTPEEITSGKFYNLKYQKDAINLGIDRINKFGGVIIADVVGLGKSVVASAIAHNFGLKTIVLAPPHLESQWKDYMSDFDFKGLVYSTGKIKDALERHGDEGGKLLIILDEAHKHRNEDTENYKLLHKLCAGNRVMALSATPFNNDPKDIYALIKLFSTPGKSTLKTVENLSMSFHQLFKNYRALRRSMRQSGKEKDNKSLLEVRMQGQEIADELRKMIEPIVIRRSRLDLDQIDIYKKDLQEQGVAFSNVKDPEILEYKLGELTDLYAQTLDKISSEDDIIGFIGTRYKSASYIRPGSDFFKKLLEEEKEEGESPEEVVQRMQQAQVNVAKFMRRLLVRRFESSIASFKISLQNMINSSQLMLDWYSKRGEVPIYKKGALPEVKDLAEMDPEEVQATLGDLEDKGLIRIPKEELDTNFERDLKHDIELLNEVLSDWKEIDLDPKYDFFEQRVKNSLSEEIRRKIVVFTEFSDTADYVYEKLKSKDVRVLKYSSSDASDANRKIIKENFDAGLEESMQSDKYDIIIATDAISEGFNLHRAGTVINYDIPYNPTRVIQRVGRINRISKKVFDDLYIWNFFPTPTGEYETHTKAISTLKMEMIHSLLGEDTRIFTSEEELRNYFAQQYKEEKEKFEESSWDAKYRNIWLNFKGDPQTMENVNKVPRRSRIARKSDKNGVVAFAKNGSNYVFAYGATVGDVEIVSPEVAMPLFEASSSDEALETTASFEPIYQVAKKHIFKDNTHASVVGNRKHDALNKLKLLSELHTPAKDLCFDIIKVIKDLDALPNGVLKDIASITLDKNQPERAYKVIKEMLPAKYLEDIFATAKRAEEINQLVVLSEELVS